jgi:hypothetical protein
MHKMHKINELIFLFCPSKYDHLYSTLQCPLKAFRKQIQAIDSHLWIRHVEHHIEPF